MNARTPPARPPAACADATMSGLTGLWKKPTPKEQARSAQRDLRGNTRELDRELLQLKREEEALVKARARGGGGGMRHR